MYPYHPTDFSFYPSLYLLYHYPLLFLDTRLPLLPNLSSLSSSLFSLYTSPCKQPRLTPTPFSILSFSFLLHPIVQSLFLSLSDSTKLSILSGATFNPPPPRPPPFFSSLHRPIHRVSTCSTLSYRSPSEHTYPHLDHPESPTNGRRQQRERPRAFSQSRYILLSVFFFFFLRTFFRHIDLRRVRIQFCRRVAVTWPARSLSPPFLPDRTYQLRGFSFCPDFSGFCFFWYFGDIVRKGVRIRTFHADKGRKRCGKDVEIIWQI